MGKLAPGSNKVADKILRTKHDVTVGLHNHGMNAELKDSWKRPDSPFHIGAEKTSITSTNAVTGASSTTTGGNRAVLKPLGRKVRNYGVGATVVGSYANESRKKKKIMDQKQVAKSSSISAFGVDHGETFSKEILGHKEGTVKQRKQGNKIRTESDVTYTPGKLTRALGATETRSQFAMTQPVKKPSQEKYIRSNQRQMGRMAAGSPWPYGKKGKYGPKTYVTEDFR